MRVRCSRCDAAVKVNPHLAGSKVPCPSCGAGIVVPSPPPRQQVAKAAPQPGPRRKSHWSFYLVAAQTVLVAIAASCFIGAFFRDSWRPPASSYFLENPRWLLAACIALLFLATMAVRFPVLSTLAAGLGILTLAAFRGVDASRTLAVAAAMLAVWLALMHRRELARAD